MDLQSGVSSSLLCLAVIVGYTALCRVLRYRRVNSKSAKYSYNTRDSMAKMTAKDAFEIQKYIFELEFPFVAEKALQFAFFRTYGIPSISSLLVRTRQLSERRFASRRYADTEVLIGEFIASEPGSERANSAISRVNWLHSIYQNQGLISNDDMLYILSLLAIEPVRWISLYEWRELNDMEICAMGTFWKSVGDAMNISYDDLPGHSTGWQDGIQWYYEVKAWSNQYEEKAMVPSAHNHQTAKETTALLLYDVPISLHPFGLQVVSAIMDPRLRRAMIYNDPPEWLEKAVRFILTFRKHAIRYLFLPRPDSLKVKMISDMPNSQGLYHRIRYEQEPWYVPNGFRYRWASPQAWMKWAMGRPIPGNEDFKPTGYSISDVGPKGLEGKGKRGFEEGKAKLMKLERNGCPFAIRK